MKRTYYSALRRTGFAVFLAHVYAWLMLKGMLPWMGDDGGTSKVPEWYTCYLIEESLSLDNLFAFYLVFRFFKVPIESQNRVLQWGIVGAIVMRATVIGAGAIVIRQFHFVLLFFAGILVYQGFKIMRSEDGADDEEDSMQSSRIVKMVQHVLPVSDDFAGSKFFVVVEGTRKATPLLLVLVVIELSDIVFAVDSVPAAFGVSHDSVVIFTANMFAILSLRSLYALIAHAVNDLPHLQMSIGAVLAFIGLKTFAEAGGIAVPAGMSLFVVMGILLVGTIMSLSARKGANKSETQLL